MKRDWMVFYRSFYEAWGFLDDNERLDYYDRILNYWIEWVEKEKGEKVEMLFALIKPNIDSNNDKYINWKKGGRPPTKKPVVSDKKNQRFRKKKSKEEVEVEEEVDVEDKEEEKVNVKDKEKKQYKDFVFLTETEHAQLLNNYWEKWSAYIRKLNDYIHQIWERKAKNKYKSHYHTILNWLRRDNIKKVVIKKQVIEEKVEMTAEQKAEAIKRMQEIRKNVLRNTTN